MVNGIVWMVLLNAIKLSTTLQILLFLPLTLSTLSTSGFLLLSLLLFLYSFAHSTLLLLHRTAILPYLQILIHPFLLLLCFNLFSHKESYSVLFNASHWWGYVLAWSSPGFVAMEGLSSLLVIQKLGGFGKQLAGNGEAYQFGLLVLAAATYVGSFWWIISMFSLIACSPLSSSLLGACLTTFVFLTFIGFNLRRTNVIESSSIALFLAYNLSLCSSSHVPISDFSVSYAPLLSNILPHLHNLVNFVTNTLPRPVILALLYRLIILHLASYVLPTIGADPWQEDTVASMWDGRPTSRLTYFLLSYRQPVLIVVYSHLLLLDHSSQVWWRWMNIYFTLFMWAIELLLVNGDDTVSKPWKMD